ncbi:MAG: hypothetical protein K6U02_04635 [Firmicutes bacterium]|nr:hypothetical protein [Bacillota bacterium]
MSGFTQAPATSAVLERREGAIAVLTLNRPERLNAINLALAERLAAAPPLAVRGIKQVLFGDTLDALRRALDAEMVRQVECFCSPDAAGGLSAFFEKRTPVFRGP